MTLRPGATNSLVDVAGLRVGHASRVGDGWRTGVTVVLARAGGAVGGVDVRGGAPGTRETDLLDPRNIVERVHAVVLSGGSAYGLAAASGVAERLADAGVGFAVSATPGEVVPIVPAAVIYDLGRGGRFRATPDAALGMAAYEDALAGVPPASGSVGAGTGALAGGLAGGVGTASVVLANGTTVAALAVVNTAGSTVDPVSGELYGVRYSLPGEYDLGRPDQADLAAWQASGAAESFHTTIGVVATDATLTKAQCAKLAGVAHDGIARAVNPAHSMIDGDTIFGLASGDRAPVGPLGLGEILAAGANAFTRAMVHGMVAAEGYPEGPSYRNVFPSAISGR